MWSLLAEADTLDTFGLALLDRGLVALRRVLLEHKPGVGGTLRCWPGLGLRWVMSTQRRGGGQGEKRSEARRGRWGALLTGRRGQGGRGTLMEGVTGLIMWSKHWRRERRRGWLGGGRRRRRPWWRLGGGGGAGPGEVIVSIALQHKQCAAAWPGLVTSQSSNKVQLKLCSEQTKSLCPVYNRHRPHSCGSSCPGTPRTWWTRPGGRWTGESGDRAGGRAGEGSPPPGLWCSGQPSPSKPGAEIVEAFANKCKTPYLEALLEFFIWTILTMSNGVTEVGYELLCTLNMISWNVLKKTFPVKRKTGDNTKYKLTLENTLGIIPTQPVSRGTVLSLVLYRHTGSWADK